MKPARPKPENTRTIMKEVEVIEDRCLVCGEWLERRIPSQRRTACKGYHRQRLWRLHKRGERAPFE